MNFQSTADQALDARGETNLSIRYREMHEAVDRAVISMEAMLQADRRWPREIEEKMKEEKMKEARMRSFDDGAETLLDYDMAGEEQVIDSFAAESQGASASEGPTVPTQIDFEGYGKILLRLRPLDLIFNRKFQSDSALLAMLAADEPYTLKAYWKLFFEALSAMGGPRGVQKHEAVEKNLREVWEAWNRLQAAATDARKVIESEGQDPSWVLFTAGELYVLRESSCSRSMALSVSPTCHDPVLAYTLNCSEGSQEGRSRMRKTLKDFIDERTAPRLWLPVPTEQECQRRIDQHKIAFLESAKALLGLLEERPQEGKVHVKGFGNIKSSESNTLAIAESRLEEEGWQGGKSFEGFEAASSAADEASIEAERKTTAMESAGRDSFVESFSSGIENLSGNAADSIKATTKAENVWGLGVMLPPAHSQTTTHEPELSPEEASPEEASLCMLHPQTRQFLTTNGKRNYKEVVAETVASLSKERRGKLRSKLSLLVSLLDDNQSSV
ncbi:hypothetical protein NliqN6_5460 [Naganishia liquefaciens]|uniref:Uncharacterized protein n=1 Tax=Naganishia liquefaciens TaxID=104408 RepID=A0A8H3TYA4_9TREE|nr:hypothetical protein NliqN6_5460 [Naganishia liquefaciens]